MICLEESFLFSYNTKPFRMKFWLPLLFLFSAITNAQTPFHQAPLDTNFISQKIKTGYVYPPYIIKNSTLKSSSSQHLPSTYDLRDIDRINYLSPIKNQGDYRTCWSFATYGSLESSWKWLGDSTFHDLSEAHMVKTHGFEGGINNDGSEQIATAYLSRLSGPVYESVEPYSRVSSPESPRINSSQDIPYYVDNIYWLNNNPNLIKELIMAHGPIATSMNASFNIGYYNFNDYTFFYNGSGGINHGVTIVGWDDNKIVKGGYIATPQQAGAWIVRNSWGINTTDNNGYFYASYEDKYIAKSGGICVGRTPVNEIDTLLDYAPLGATSAYFVGDKPSNSAYAAVKYTTTKDLLITDIGTSTFDEGTKIEYTLCLDFDGQTFMDTIAQQSAVLKLSGYHKTKIKAAVPKGDFYIITHFQTPNSYYPLPAETFIKDYALPTIEKNKLWLSINGNDWMPGGLSTDYNFDLSIKVHAQYPKSINPDFSHPEFIITNDNTTFHNETIGEVDSFVWCVNNDTITEIDQRDLTYTFTQAGKYEVKLIAYHNTEIAEKSTIISCLSHINPTIIVANANNYYSRHDSIIMTAQGANTYKWYISKQLYNANNPTVVFKPTDDSTIVILEGTMREQVAYDTICIVLANAPYDDIEDAGIINLGEKIENLSIKNASLQNHEICPSALFLHKTLERCQLNSRSLWFQFEAPSSGAISIELKGLFSNLALYAANSGAEDILSEDTTRYQLISINDYQEISSLTTRITEIQGLRPQQIYWLQLNGYDSKEKDNYLLVKAEQSAALKPTSSRQLEVINTPSLFSIKGCPECSIKVYNNLGELVYTRTPDKTYHKHITPGLHIVHIKTDNGYYTYKTISKEDWRLELTH